MSDRSDDDRSFDQGAGEGDSPLNARLRGAYRRQLDDVHRQVGDRQYAAVLDPAGPKPSSRILVAAAAVFIGVIGVAGGNWLLGRPDAEVVETGPFTTAEDNTEAPIEPTPLTQVPTISVPPTSVPAANPGIDTDSDADADADTEVANDEQPTTTATRPPTPAAVSSGVANEVCPSGARAELEWASLQYVGASRGWGRLEDLVDEQDGPFYVKAWEPGFPDPVAVQLVLDQPVLASEIRLALHPSDPMTGTIFIQTGGQSIELELSGADEWRVHQFDQLLLIDRLRIERTSAESDITELLVCIAPNQ